MRARDIHAAAQELVGQPLNWSSVKATLAEHTRPPKARFERVSHGRYRLPSRALTRRSVLPGGAKAAGRNSPHSVRAAGSRVATISLISIGARPLGRSNFLLDQFKPGGVPCH